MHKDEEDARRRRSQYLLWIAVALAIAAGRIAVVRSAEGDTAFLSANDRSRWCTVAALVEDGTYEIDRLVEIRSIRNRRPWGTIDRVVHRGSDGAMHSYSSKPPLLATVVAGVYAIFYTATGITLTEQPIYATRILLAIVNLPLLALFYLGTIGAIERVGRGYWPRQFAAAGVCFGTLVLPFAVTLNNHLPAAAATALVLWIFVSAAEALDEEFTGVTARIPWTRWALAGAAAAFVVANELPALSMFCLWWLLFAWLQRRSILPFTLGAACVAVAFFGTNWIAHQSLRPPYAHRGVGDHIGTVTPATSAEQLAESVRNKLISRKLIAPSTSITIQPSDEPQRLRAVTSDQQQFALLPRVSNSASQRAASEGTATEAKEAVTATDPTPWMIHHWDDWYEYPGSYWQEGRRRGVDVGEPDWIAYLFHATFGHHGLFSITPLWLLVPLGLFLGIRSGLPDSRLLFAAIALASLVCFVFYIARPEIDRNYGGVSVGFRWMIWFAPLWLFSAAPAIARVSRSRNGRIVLYVFLAISVFSVATSLESPWQSPWIYRYWSFLGWISN